jgi:hypothetical protein
MAVKPSFLKDPDQAAELAALLQDIADDRQNDLDRLRQGDLSRSDHVEHVQRIARYRRWAAELVTEPEAEAPAPVQIRPATQRAEEATG